MPIQWFPGHMNSARRKAAETMARVDVVIEVVDARLPEASANPMIRELAGARQRPRLKVLNKSDLADAEATRQWLAYYRQQPGVSAVALSCKSAVDVARIVPLAQQLAPHRNDGTKPLRLMVMGVPNVGKSTLMNALLKKRVAAVGDEPAVTKSQQSLQIGPDTWLTDTPGLMWPKIAHDSDGYMLAASHAIGVNAVIEEEVATFLGGLLLARYPQAVAARYRLKDDEVAVMDGVGLIETVARKRGVFRKLRGGGNEPDREKASLILLGDYRSGALGRISLETPETRAAMLASAVPAPAAEAEAEGEVE
jgi:ribosome biogenesis GTPase A